MKQTHFVQTHPLHIFSECDYTDYSHRDNYFIQSLKAMENFMDIDAYIIDYLNRRILYATKGCSAYFGNKADKNTDWDIDHLDKIILPEDLSKLAIINSRVYDFFYALPKERRQLCYFTQDFRVQTKKNPHVLINHKGTVLDLTDNGTLRLTLCIISHPTSDKPGNAYIKMTDDNTVYRFISSSGKFVEVKTQKLTSKAATILKLTSNGKTEIEIAEILKISVNTVKYHKKRIFAQLEVKNAAEAIQWMNNQKKMVRR